MQRRTALQAIGTAMVGAIAGCASQRQSSGEQPSSTGSQRLNTDDSSETADSLSRPITSDDIAFDVTVLQQFTNDSPAQLEVRFTNDSDTRLTLFGGPILPFTGLEGVQQDRDVALLLMPEDNSWITPTDGNGEVRDVPLVPPSRTDSCWTVEYEGMLRKQTMLVDELRTGESISHTYSLLDWGNESCLPTGSYAFRGGHSLQRGESSVETGKFEVTLGFEAELDTERRVSVTVQDPTVRKHTH